MEDENEAAGNAGSPGDTNDIKSYVQNTIENVKDFAKSEVVPQIVSITENTKSTVENISNIVKTSITEDQILDVLDNLYGKAVSGIPKVSPSVADLAADYIKKNGTAEKAAKSLINNSIVKCGTTGFLTGFGGFASMIVTLPANITSAMYVQLRMCCAIATMAEYDIHSDQVRTLIYACLTGSDVGSILEQDGIELGSKWGVEMVKKIPGKTASAIKRKVALRFAATFGEKGIMNLGSVVPVLGAFIGGGLNVASTRTIGSNAYKIFMKGGSADGGAEDEIPCGAESEEAGGIDTEALETAAEENALQKGEE